LDLRSQLQTTLGDAYAIERELGGGGMSRVFVATERALGRKVVIKVLSPDTTGHVSVERFRREIAVVAHLQHPHIVPLLTAGDTAGLPYFTMPFVKGESLRMRVAREGELPVSEAIRILREIASALAFAHDAGIVHRDIKPDNVLLSAGAAMVSDFGVAKAIAVAASKGGEGLTTAGLAIGTPAYMAPEQASADTHIDRRVDLYAWGIVAYELLTGRTPFAGRPASAMLAAHVTEPVESVNTRRRAVPAALAALVMKCLEKRPADRVQTAAEIVHELDAVTTPSGGTPAAIFRGDRASFRRWAMGAAIATLVVSAAVAVLRRSPPAFVSGRAVAVVSSSDELELDAAISPDGRLVAFTAGPLGARRIFVKQVAGGRSLAVSEGVTGDHRWARWNPDGSAILFHADSGFYSVAPLGGPVTPLPGSNAAIATADWSPDGSAIVFRRGDTLLIQAIAGGTPRPVASGGDIAAPAWSPNGKHIAFARGNSAYVNAPGNVAPSSVWIVSADGGDPWPVTDSSRFNSAPVWSPDGRSVLFVSDRDGTRDVYEQPLNARIRPTGPAMRLTSGLNVYSFSLSADGTRMAYSVLLLRRNIWAAPIRADRPSTFRDARQITRESHSVEGLSVSRDGKWLLYDSNRDGNQDLFKLALADDSLRSGPVQLTRNTGNNFMARLSPDSHEIVFYSTRLGARQVFIMNADGGDVSGLSAPGIAGVYPDWSPDGRQIVFSKPEQDVEVSRRNQDRTWSPPRKTSAAACVGGAAASFPRWSPDGRWISVTCRAGAVHLIDAGGGAPRVLPLPGIAAWFAEWGTNPDIAFVKQQRTGAIWAISVASGRAKLVFTPDDPRFVAARQEFATDGRRLYFTVATDDADLWIMELTRQ